MFLAIINDTYSNVKSEISTERSISMSDYLKHCFQNLCKKSRRSDNEQSPRKVLEDGKLTYKEIRDILKK